MLDIRPLHFEQLAVRCRVCFIVWAARRLARLCLSWGAAKCSGFWSCARQDPGLVFRPLHCGVVPCFFVPDRWGLGGKSLCSTSVRYVMRAASRSVGQLARGLHGDKMSRNGRSEAIRAMVL